MFGRGKENRTNCKINILIYKKCCALNNDNTKNIDFIRMGQLQDRLKTLNMDPITNFNRLEALQGVYTERKKYVCSFIAKKQFFNKPTKINICP